MAGLLRNIETVGGDSMSTKKRATKLKVMRHLDKDRDGNNTIHSIVANPPKLKEAVDSAKLPAIRKPSTIGIETKAKDVKPKLNGKASELDHKILKAIDTLGGKDVSTI